MIAQMNDNLKLILEQQYFLPNVKFVGMAGGLSALNFILSSNGQEHILKKYRSNNEKVIKRIENITNFLGMKNLPIVSPIKSRIGTFHIQYDGSYYSLFPKVSGHTFHEPSFCRESLDSVAKVIAQFHKLGVQDQLGLDNSGSSYKTFEVVFTDGSQVIDQIKNGSIDSETDQLTIQLIKGKIELIKYVYAKTNSYSFETIDFVHGDFHNENMMFDENKHLKYLFDFEEVHIGHRTEDVIKFIHFACCNSGFEKKKMENARYFLSCYRKYNQLSSKDIEYGVYYYLLWMLTSFFFEKELYRTRNRELKKYISRDLAKLSCFKKHLSHHITHLSI